MFQLQASMAKVIFSTRPLSKLLKLVMLNSLKTTLLSRFITLFLYASFKDVCFLHTTFNKCTKQGVNNAIYKGTMQSRNK